MGSAQPIPGRCGARLRGERKGQFCARYPAKGKTRCRNHGGGVNPETGRGSGAPIKHGRYSQRYRKGSQAFVERLEANLADPDLLDARRPVAVMAAMLELWSLMPDDETLRELATTPEMREMGVEPRDIDIEEQRLRFLEQNRKQVESWHKAQMAVLREIGVRQALEQAVPTLLGRFFLALRSTVERMVSDPQLRERLLESFASDARLVLLQVGELAEQKRKAS